MSISKSRFSSHIWQKHVFGFTSNDFKSREAFVRLMSRPEDPSSLAAFRIAFGILMMLDIPHERGFAYVDYVYGETGDVCRFPLFNFLKPLPGLYMSIIYTAMFFGALGIALGFCYRLSAFVFTSTYWFVFLLDKTSWNNHSYLYGLIGLMMCFFDAHHYWSIDGILNNNIKNADIPLWNYFVLRSQIFLVYFIAGLKKTEYDWLAGYSFTHLGEHWVFAPFRLILPTKLVTWLVIHGSGFIIDTFVGFFLFFDKTRLIGTIIVSSFHLMNSQIFAIGMFPWTMLATTAIFYSNDWPKRLIHKLFFSNKDDIYPDNNKTVNTNPKCIYAKTHVSIQLKSPTESRFDLTKNPVRASFKHKLFAFVAVLYVATQIFMPYSHFITKGYNGWTSGLYGYSWDMMVHSWHTQHVKITVVNKDNKIYLDPKKLTGSSRWSSHPDMIKQYATCIASYVSNRTKWENVEVFMDIWRSMNGRFVQRQVKPNVDLAAAPWSPFRQTEWMVPLLTNLSHWRNTLRHLEENVEMNDSSLQLTFVSDLPGLILEHYVEAEYNTAIYVLQGQVTVEYTDEHGRKKNVTLNEKETAHVPSEEFHKVYTVSSFPSCYLYVYRNETHGAMLDALDVYERLVMKKINTSLGYPIQEDEEKLAIKTTLNIPKSKAHEVKKLWNDKIYAEVARMKLENVLEGHEMKDFLVNHDSKVVKKTILRSLNATFTEVLESPLEKFQNIAVSVVEFFKGKYHHYRRAFYVVLLTIRCLVTGESLEYLLLHIYDLKY